MHFSGDPTFAGRAANSWIYQLIWPLQRFDWLSIRQRENTIFGMFGYRSRVGNQNAPSMTYMTYMNYVYYITIYSMILQYIPILVDIYLYTILEIYNIIYYIIIDIYIIYNIIYNIIYMYMIYSLYYITHF